MATNYIYWNPTLFNALWVDQITPTVAIKNYPYYLAYGKESVLPSNFLLPSLHIAQYCSQDDESSPLQDRIDTLLKLEEEREKSENKLYQHQQLVNIWFDDKSSTSREFQIEDLVLKWEKTNKDKRDYTKFQCLWLGTFIVTENIGLGAMRLQTFEGLSETYPMNIHLLKKCFS